MLNDTPLSGGDLHLIIIITIIMIVTIVMKPVILFMNTAE